MNDNYSYDKRLKIKNIESILKIPINEPVKYSDNLIITAIKYGMIIIINYKGKRDSHYAGHERTIYPMVIGKSKSGKTILRAWHLSGWSISLGRYVNKVWRLFRTDRILSLTFTGMFYRLPPAGYNMNDRGMRGGIIASANFDIIRKNQQELIKLSREYSNRIIYIRVVDNDERMSLKNLYKKLYLQKFKNSNHRYSSILRSHDNNYALLIGDYYEQNLKVKLINHMNNKVIGDYIIIQTCRINDLYKYYNKYYKIDFKIYVQK